MKPVFFTNKGGRNENQDYVIAQHINQDTLLMIVSDGMGGYEYGQEAARLVAENLLAYLSTLTEVCSDHLQKAINKANLAIKQLKQDKNINAGATVGGIVLTRNNALCFWVGDVLILHFRDQKILFESKSHTLINEVKKNGSIQDAGSLEKYRHVVTRAVQGDLKASQIETRILEDITKNDIFIVCSDGVHDVLDGFSILHHFNLSNDIEEAAKTIEKRLHKESKDNYSMIINKMISDV